MKVRVLYLESDDDDTGILAWREGPEPIELERNYVDADEIGKLNGAGTYLIVEVDDDGEVKSYGMSKEMTVVQRPVEYEELTPVEEAPSL